MKKRANQKTAIFFLLLTAAAMTVYGVANAATVSHRGADIESPIDATTLEKLSSAAILAAMGWSVSGNNLLSIVSGNVGIGTNNPTQRLDVNGTAQVTGLKMPTGAASGRVLTSDAVGVGTWQAASGGSVLVNYGYFDSYPLYNPNPYHVSSCPSGWTDAGVGIGAVTYTFSGGGWAQGTQMSVITQSYLRPAYRTCFRTDKACLTLVNYGYFDAYPYYNPYPYHVSSCPSGWTDAGVGIQPPQIKGSGDYTSPAYRTCFLCP